MHNIINGIDVGPSFCRWVLCCFDGIEVDSVGEEVDSAHQDQYIHSGVFIQTAQRVGKALALKRRHRPIVKVEPTEGCIFLPPDEDLLESGWIRARWNNDVALQWQITNRLFGNLLQNLKRRELDEFFRASVESFQMRNPNGAAPA